MYDESFRKHICLVIFKPALVHYKPNTVYLGGDSLECSWNGFLEKESEVSYYTFDVGTTEGDDSVYTSIHLEAGTCAHRVIGPVSVSRYMARLPATGADWGLDIKNNIRWMTVVTSD